VAFRPEGVGVFFRLRRFYSKNQATVYSSCLLLTTSDVSLSSPKSVIQNNLLIGIIQIIGKDLGEVPKAEGGPLHISEILFYKPSHPSLQLLVIYNPRGLSVAS
jgi:hypothetical protein